MPKSRDAFRTISEVADWLETPAHVLRFWESKFTQVKPVKRAGGRRYYRPGDMELLGGIKKLLHEDGMTIKGVQKVLREQGVRYVAGLSVQVVDDADAEVIDDAPFTEVVEAPRPDPVVAFPTRAATAPADDLTPETDSDAAAADVDPTPAESGVAPADATHEAIASETSPTGDDLAPLPPIEPEDTDDPTPLEAAAQTESIDTEACEPEATTGATDAAEPHPDDAGSGTAAQDLDSIQDTQLVDASDSDLESAAAASQSVAAAHDTVGSAADAAPSEDSLPILNGASPDEEVARDVPAALPSDIEAAPAAEASLSPDPALSLDGTVSAQEEAAAGTNDAEAEQPPEAPLQDAAQDVPVEDSDGSAQTPLPGFDLSPTQPVPETDDDAVLEDVEDASAAPAPSPENASVVATDDGVEASASTEPQLQIDAPPPTADAEPSESNAAVLVDADTNGTATAATSVHLQDFDQPEENGPEHVAPGVLSQFAQLGPLPTETLQALSVEMPRLKALHDRLHQRLT